MRFFSASAIVEANTDVLHINLPDCGAHAEVGWFNTASDHAATAANQEYNIEGWVKLK